MNLAIKLINEGLKDEKKAPKFYIKLKKALPYKYRVRIKKIQNQEKEHYKILKKIKKELKE